MSYTEEPPPSYSEVVETEDKTKVNKLEENIISKDNLKGHSIGLSEVVKEYNFTISKDKKTMSI